MAQDKQGKTDQDKDNRIEDRKPKSGNDMQGEGNYEAARRYNEKTTEHAQGGGVEQAAREAEPSNRAEQRELEGAEKRGRERAKEEDPLLEHPEEISKDDSASPR